MGVRGGAPIRTLANDQAVDGSVEVTWDGKDDAGNLVDAGPAMIEVSISDGPTTFQDAIDTGVIHGAPIALPSPVSSDLTGTDDFNVPAGWVGRASGWEEGRRYV